MKKRICLALLIVTVFTFVACGTQTTSAKSVVPESASEISLPTNITQETCGTQTTSSDITSVDDGLIELNIFEDIEQYIRFTGPNGFGYASVELPKNYFRDLGGDFYLVEEGVFWWAGEEVLLMPLSLIYKNDRIGCVDFDIKESGLSGGDSVDVHAIVRYKEGCGDVLRENGYKISSRTKKVTVPDLGVYLTSMEQLTPTVVNSIKTIMSKEYAGTIYKYYYGTYKPGVICDHKNTTFVMAIGHKKGNYFSGGYNTIKIYDIIILPDESVTFRESQNNPDIGYPENSTLEKIIEEILNSNSFDFIEIE